MDSLVGYGVSSDSDSDGDVHTGRVGCVQEAGEEATAVKNTRNLLESGSTSSDSGSETELEDKDPKPFSPQPHPLAPVSSAACQPSLPAPLLDSLNHHKLPPPPLNASSDSSVFANPFKAQAEQKLTALQKHVPLTMQAKPCQIGGKRICVSYRKDGRCRFGIKCKFAHDSDLQNPVTPTDSHYHNPPVNDEESASEHAEPHPGGSSGGQAQRINEEECGQQVKKKRVGLSNTLIPPKRAMKQYAMHTDRRRVNMS